MARESGGANSQRADRQPEREKRLPASQEEQTGRQADTIIGATGREAGGNKERKENHRVSREKRNRRCRQAEEELDKRGESGK